MTGLLVTKKAKRDTDSSPKPEDDGDDETTVKTQKRIARRLAANAKFLGILAKDILARYEHIFEKDTRNIMLNGKGTPPPEVVLD